jgi:acyl carrier protein
MLTELTARETDVLAVTVERIRELSMDDELAERQIQVTDSLSELGLNSLMLAQILIELEAEYGADPFAGGERSVTELRTVGDLVRSFAELTVAKDA